MRIGQRVSSFFTGAPPPFIELIHPLAQAIAALPAPTRILDGEVWCSDEKLVSRFPLLSEPGESVPATNAAPPLKVRSPRWHRCCHR
jgi:ATP-dependent DNA ligase